MAKSTLSPGNVAISGIAGTPTTKPTTALPGAGTASASAPASAGGRTTSVSRAGSADGSSTVRSPSAADSFYAALAAGIPAPGAALQPMAPAQSAQAAAALVNTAKASLPQTNPAPVNYIDIAQQTANLKTQEAGDKARAVSAIDAATARSTAELARNLQNSRGLYQTQRSQIDADEARALDNQALYAEARGDKGGIGRAQYGAIQNTAANNRQAVNAAEVRLQTDTARQIADLRAKGEYEKADKVAEISSKYLSELTALQKWAKEKNAGIEEFNAKLLEWQNDYHLSLSKYLTDTEIRAAQLYGVSPDGTITAEEQNALQNRYANAAKAMLQAGIVPSAAQLEAMGWTPEQYWVWQMAQKASGA